MQTDKINQTGTSSNSDSLKNMEEQSGKPTDGSQAYLDVDDAATESAPMEKDQGKDQQRSTESDDKE